MGNDESGIHCRTGEDSERKREEGQWQKWEVKVSIRLGKYMDEVQYYIKSYIVRSCLNLYFIYDVPICHSILV